MVDHKKGVRLLPILCALLLVLLALAGASLYYAAKHGDRADAAGTDVRQLKVLVHSMSGDALLAVTGDVEAFGRLTTSSQQARVLASGLQVSARIPGIDEMLDSADSVVASRQTVLAAYSAVDEIDAAVSALVGSLTGLGDSVPVASRAAVEDAVKTSRRVATISRSLLGEASDLESATRSLGDDEMMLGQLVLGLTGQDSTLGLRPLRAAEREQHAAALQSRYGQINEGVLATIAGAISVDAARRSAENLANQAIGVTGRLSEATRVPTAARLGPIDLGSRNVALILIAIGLLVALAAVVFSFSGEDTRRSAEFQANMNERNQTAILRLLDELGSLADGDLTVQATVTEDITGAIADSINYAIEALRELVATIEDSAIKIDDAAKQTRATAGHLAQASETQSKQVGDASESIARMAASIEAVSGDAERSADVARHSVDVAHKGGDAVRRTIEGMNTIRETIQDTSKRIKRLGESSQEIGNIVELINDIAEQTNILALNASIQASMAGEAGRGFAVVADEVQRLAERSANATKQIEVLVKTIQSDTNEAVVSMERSTTDVVGGALLAENAGAALDEIESVSNQIANLVQNISSTASEQATAATDVTRNMGVLREVSSQTAEATGATSDSIGKLAELASQLRNSVAGFRLPESSKKAGPHGRKEAAERGVDFTSARA